IPYHCSLDISILQTGNGCCYRDRANGKNSSFNQAVKKRTFPCFELSHNGHINRRILCQQTLRGFQLTGKRNKLEVIRGIMNSLQKVPTSEVIPTQPVM